MASAMAGWRKVGGRARGPGRAFPFVCYPRWEMSLRSRYPAKLGILALLAAGGLLVVATLARAQMSTIAPQISPVESMLALRAGTFEVWQDTTRLGTEFYSAYLTARRDTAAVTSHITYELHSGRATMHYEKRTLRLASGLDNRLFVYQAHEDIGQNERGVAVTSYDTTATIYHEADGKGAGNVIEVPHGRIYLLDASVYEQVEWLTRDFVESGLQTRTFHTLIPPRDTVIAIQLTRGPKEKVQGPGGKPLQAQRVDINDDMTKIVVWMDDQGNLVRLEAPAQKVRVIRLPAGDAEAQALARAARPANSSGASAKR